MGTYAKFSVSDNKDIEQTNLNLKLIDSGGTGLVDNKGNAVAESSKSILEFSIIKQKKVDFILTSVLQAIVKIENFGDGFESQKQNIDDEVNCGVILEKLKGFLKKDNTAEAEVALSEIVFDIQNKKLNNIKGSIKKLIRLADDFKTIRTTSKTSLTLLQADFGGITGKELDFDFEIDGNLGKVVVRPMEGMIMKSEETLLEETRSQFIQSIKSKNSLSVLKTALDKIKSGTSGSSTLTMKFDQFSTILEEIILIIDQDVLNDRLQSLVVRILKISKTTFATTLSTAEKDFVSEAVTTIEKSVIKTKKVYEVVKQSLKKVTGKDVDESKLKIETINDDGNIQINGVEQTFSQSKAVMKQTLSTFVSKQIMLNNVLMTLNLLRSKKEKRKEKDMGKKSFNGVLTKIKQFLKLIEEENTSVAELQSAVSTIVQFSNMVVGSSKSNLKEIKELSQSVMDKKLIIDQEVTLKKQQLEQKIGSKISLENFGLPKFSELTGEVVTSTKFETSQIETMNMEFVSLTKSYDAISKLTSALKEVVSKKGGIKGNEEITQAKEFLALISELMDILENSSTNSNIQMHA